MFLTVTPNLCIERTVEIADFRVGAVYRVPPPKLSVNAGGKGINAARVATRLGCSSLALAWVGQNQRAWFEEQLAREEVAFELIEVAADTRVCTNIVHGDGVKTEIVEAGAPLQISDGEKMLEKFESLLPRAQMVAVGGSYPSSGDESTQAVFDAHLIELSALARRFRTPLLVDGKGRAFEKLLRSSVLPWAIKPNGDEAEEFLRYPVRDEIGERRALADFLALGIEAVLLTCGERGAYLGTRDGTHYLKPPHINTISTVGAGDAFVGAFAARYLATGNLLESTRWGVVAGAASAGQKLSAFCTREDIESLLPQVSVQTMT